MKTLLPFALIALAIGCGSPGSGSPGRTVARYRNGGDAKIARVSESGQYALFQPGQTAPVAMFPLRKDEPIGFRKTDQGLFNGAPLNPQLWGVAGQNDFLISPGSDYVWNKIDTQQAESAGNVGFVP